MDSMTVCPKFMKNIQSVEPVNTKTLSGMHRISAFNVCLLLFINISIPFALKRQYYERFQLSGRKSARLSCLDVLK